MSKDQKSRDTGFDAKGLGERVRRVRLERGLTLKQIEAQVGVSATHVSEVERGKTSPTVGALGKIARALKVDVAYLIEIDPEPRCHVSKPSERRSLVLEDGGARLTPLSSSARGIELSFFEVTIPPGGSADPRPARIRGEEVLTGLSGQVRVKVNDEVLDLGAGDALHVKSTGPIRFENVDSETARFLWASYPKIVL